MRSERIALAVRGGLDDPRAGPARRERLASLVDDWLAQVWDDAAPPAAGVSLVAVGGHARRDAGPAGDLDLVLLHGGGPADVGALADALWYPIWDAGLRLDHAVRSLEECRAVARVDDAAAVGLIDLRPVAGDVLLAGRARDVLRADWRRGAARRLPSLLGTVAERARRHGELAYLLEGDLKEARGGLRDGVVLQALVASWLADVPHEAAGAYARLLDVRDALHAVTGRPGERLLLAEQDAVAAALGLPDADALLADVAASARTLAYALDSTARRARGATVGRRSLRRRRPQLRTVGDGLVEHDGELSLDARALPQADPALAVRAAAAAAREQLPLSPVTAAHLAAAAVPLPEPWPDAAREALLELLGSGEALAGVWEALDQAGLVLSWLPEWAGVRNRAQRTPVHRHTVDRHQVQTCVEAAALLGDISRPDLLLLAALLHDIGKLPGAADHSAVGAPIAYRCAVRLGLPACDAAVVERLVREHLTLVELATRRDPDDPRTVVAAVAAVDGREDLLDLLRALTEADARAAGPAAWTAWRRTLVDDLVARTRTALAGAEPPGPAPLTPDEAALLAAVGADGEPRILITPFSGQHAVTVVSPDRRGLFADVAGLLSAHGLAVRSALVRTTDGVAVDTWWVHAPSGLPDPAVLRTGLRRLADGDAGPLDRLHRREASWVPVPAAAPPRVLLVPGASTTATVLEVRAADRPGLLHALGRALTEVGADIRSAHVVTHAGRAVDVIYVTEPDGSRLPPSRVAQVIGALSDAAEVAGGRR
ncbi:MAG TPA: [protein-PII] uridylyltransferase [Actinomycetales bacterium]|nr:[protein-PII] uridylyltransferase [Actinomycetales bacterium]